MRVVAEFNVPGAADQVFLEHPSRNSDWFSVDFGTFGHHTDYDYYCDLITSKFPWMRRSAGSWFCDLSGLAQAVGSKWPTERQCGIVPLLPEPLSHGKTNYYGKLYDVSILTLRTKLEVALHSMDNKIFLSHKGVDKELVRQYFETLRLLGFRPWLDDEAMVAGVELERGLLQGFSDSCAAVFFVTPAFNDEQYLATEVNYAIAERRTKGQRFQIITLVLKNVSGEKGTVPNLLRQFVWKEPENDLQGIQEVVRALPVAVGPVAWRPDL